MITQLNSNNKIKKILLRKVLTHMGTKENKEADKAAKQAIDTPRMPTTRLSFTDY